MKSPLHVIFLLIVFLGLPARAEAADPCPFSGTLFGGGWQSYAAAKLELREIRLRFEDGLTARMVGVRFEPSRFDIRLRWQAAAGDKAPESAEEVARQTSAAIVLNASFFDTNGRPLGYFRSSGKVYNRRVLFRGRSDALHLGALFAVSEAEGTPRIVPRRVFDPKGIRDAFQAGPYLIRGGEPLRGLEKYREYLRAARRTIVGFDRKGRMVVLVSEPETRGISWCELQDFLVRPESEGGLEIQDAMNLDGGSSSQLYVRAEGVEMHLSGRHVPSLIVIKSRMRRAKP